jgi:single-strand DNA-binding protein
MANQEAGPARNRTNTPRFETPPAETTEGRLVTAVRSLLDALERCSGDPPDCPHCGPARAFALEMLTPAVLPEPPKTEQERVQLAGRVGGDPTFRTTAKGTQVGRFSLAVRNEDNSTTWYPIVAFNRRADQMKGVVEKGAALSVVGYLHSREARSRDGKPRTITEVYAVAVTSLGSRKKGGT